MIVSLDKTHKVPNYYVKDELKRIRIAEKYELKNTRNLDLFPQFSIARPMILSSALLT
jgi:hypothetical protein